MTESETAKAKAEMTLTERLARPLSQTEAQVINILLLRLTCCVEGLNDTSYTSCPHPSFSTRINTPNQYAYPHLLNRTYQHVSNIRSTRPSLPTLLPIPPSLPTNPPPYPSLPPYQPSSLSFLPSLPPSLPTLLPIPPSLPPSQSQPSLPLNPPLPPSPSTHHLNPPSLPILTLSPHQPPFLTLPPSLPINPCTFPVQVADMRRAMEDLRHQGRQRVAALITEGTVTSSSSRHT